MEGCGSSRSTESEEGESVCSNPASVSVLYTNAQSIVNKIDELCSVAVNIKPNIILINETWTHKGITNAYFHIKGYELSARKDRTDTEDGRVGGLLVYSKIGMIVRERNTETKALAINLVYRSPNSTTENNEQLNKFTRNLS